MQRISRCCFRQQWIGLPAYHYGIVTGWRSVVSANFCAVIGFANRKPCTRSKPISRTVKKSARVNGSIAGLGGVCALDGGGQCQTQQSWVGTTRARVGYAFDRWLPYVTGGVAYGNIQAVQPIGTSTSTNIGWTAGAGLEYAIDRKWRGKLEYLHIDLGTATFMGAASSTSTLAVPVTNELVRAGIN